MKDIMEYPVTLYSELQTNAFTIYTTNPLPPFPFNPLSVYALSSMYKLISLTSLWSPMVSSSESFMRKTTFLGCLACTPSGIRNLQQWPTPFVAAFSSLACPILSNATTVLSLKISLKQIVLAILHMLISLKCSSHTPTYTRYHDWQRSPAASTKPRCC